MKRILPTIFIILSLLNTGYSTDLTITKDATILGFGDSCVGDSSGDIPSTGFMATDYIGSYFVLKYPQFRITPMTLYRSGANNDDMWTNRLEKLGLALWGYQQNDNQNIGYLQASDGGDQDSNTIFNTYSNMLLAPGIFNNGAINTNEGGWCTNHTLQLFGWGGFPEYGSANGAFVKQGQRNNAVVNAGNLYGFKGLDSFNLMSNKYAIDYVSGLNQFQYITNGAKTGHLEAAGQVYWAILGVVQMDSDTNIADFSIDWSGTIVTTNHCVASSVTQSGGQLNFTMRYDRLPMAWDKTATYDCTGIFSLVPELADYQKFVVKIPNIPAGNYNVLAGGITIATLSSTVLANGWNMFTNTVGPIWQQRTNVLAKCRILDGADPETHVGVGNGPGSHGYGSTASGQWAAGARGDALISGVASTVDAMQTDVTALHNAAQPQDFMFSIVPVFQPAPFR
jgi:hypothetical protein